MTKDSEFQSDHQRRPTTLPSPGHNLPITSALVELDMAPVPALHAAAEGPVTETAVAAEVERAGFEDEDLVALGARRGKVDLNVLVLRVLEVGLGALRVEDDDVLARVLLGQVVHYALCEARLHVPVLGGGVHPDLDDLLDGAADG